MKLKQIKTQAQKGFTMIELVIVIAILGILAAFALPRFANFSQNSSDAAARSVAGTLNASMGIVKAKYIAGGSTGTTVDIDGNAATTNDIVKVTSTGDINWMAVDCPKMIGALLTNTNGLTIPNTSAGSPNDCGIFGVNGGNYIVNIGNTGLSIFSGGRFITP
jgi:prepilin-type N-terminal cleavage/methylation domain-containing protein